MSEESPRELRLGTAVRGTAIVVLLVAYGYLLKAPTVSFQASLLIAAGLQAAILGMRRWVSADQWPKTQALFELLADAITVLLFALAVFGGIVRAGADV